MAALGKLLRTAQGGLICFWCPGCDEAHCVDSTWTFNLSAEAPTFSPSILVRSGHFLPGHTGNTCWCTYNAEHPDEEDPFTCTICHSFVRDGMIEFLSDCTHKLAGQTVLLPEFSKTYNIGD